MNLRRMLGAILLLASASCSDDSAGARDGSARDQRSKDGAAGTDRTGDAPVASDLPRTDAPGSDQARPSDQGPATPDQGTSTPEKGTVTSDKGTATPDKGTATPDKGTATPDKGTLPDTKKADTLKADTLKPDTLKPDTLKPDTLKPDTLKPDTLKPDALKPDTLKPDTTSSNTCSTGFAGCTAFTDGTGGPQTISFTNFVYTPKCLRVKVGQAVTFSGSFSAHPLAQACGPAQVITTTSTGSSTSFTFSATGLYGYFCTAHGDATGNGMAGALEVVP